MTGEPVRVPVVERSGVQAGPSPIFRKVGIVGLGLIGGSIGLATRRIWPSALVVAVDRKDVIEKAMPLGAMDIGAEDPVVLAEADLVVLAAPVRQNVAMVDALPKHVRGAAVVTDTGSTKRTIMSAARALPERLTFVGGHPLGGGAKGGIEYARPDLFSGQPWLLTPADGTPGEIVERLSAFASALGAVPRVMGAGEHDRLLALTSHLPQLAVSALMSVVGGAVGEEGLQLSGRGLVDTTRLASSPPELWKDVCATNTDEIAKALDSLIDRLSALRENLDSGEELERVFAAANTWRDTLLGNRS